MRLSGGFGRVFGKLRTLVSDVSKMLVVVAEIDNDGWFTAAWSYDGRSGGIVKNQKF